MDLQAISHQLLQHLKQQDLQLKQLIADSYAMRSQQPINTALLAASIKVQMAQCTAASQVTGTTQLQQQQLREPKSKAEAARRRRSVTLEARIAKAQRANQRQGHASQQPHQPGSTLSEAQGLSRAGCAAQQDQPLSAAAPSQEYSMQPQPSNAQPEQAPSMTAMAQAAPASSHYEIDVNHVWQEWRGNFQTLSSEH